MRAILIFAAGAWAVCALTARAAERITLRNGFEMSCSHHIVADSRVRLYLSPGTDNYIEVAPGDIAKVESVPDPPVAPHEPATIPPPQNTSHTPGGAQGGEARLSSADLGEMLANAGHAHNLDVDLLASVVKAESGGNVHAISRTGARGLMQLMPGTAAELGVADSFRPDQNVRGGSTYLDSLLTRYHDNLALALAAYNAGPAAVDKYHGIPPYRETKLYVARVIHEFNRRVLARETQSRRAVAAAFSQGHAGR